MDAFLAAPAATDRLWSEPKLIGLVWLFVVPLEACGDEGTAS